MIARAINIKRRIRQGEERMHYVTATVAVLFFIAMGYSLIEQDTDNAVVQMVIGTVLFIFTIIFKRDNRNKNELTSWIKLNHQQIMNEGSIFNGVVIDHETKFIQYEICISIGIFSFRKKTGYYIKEYSFTPLLNLFFTAFTLIFGWWAIPMGPIHTIKVLYHNISSKPKRIDEVISEIV